MPYSPLLFLRPPQSDCPLRLASSRTSHKWSDTARSLCWLPSRRHGCDSLPVPRHRGPRSREAAMPASPRVDVLAALAGRRLATGLFGVLRLCTELSGRMRGCQTIFQKCGTSHDAAVIATWLVTEVPAGISPVTRHVFSGLIGYSCVFFGGNV